MIAKSNPLMSSGHILRSAVMMFAAFLCLGTALAQPFTVRGPGVNSIDFRITTFASGLDFPLGMAKLSDGSLLVIINQGTDYFNSTGKLVRFVDANEDGVADGPGTVLYAGLPASQTAVRVAGNLIFATGQTKPIIVMRAGDSPSAPLTLVGRITIIYPGSWYHPNSALGVRNTPGHTNRHDRP